VFNAIFSRIWLSVLEVQGLFWRFEGIVYGKYSPLRGNAAEGLDAFGCFLCAWRLFRDIMPDMPSMQS